MDHRNFKSKYTPQGLDWWLNQLEKDWEPSFSKDAIALGRDMYRNNHVRGLDIQVGIATIYTKIEKEEHYVIIESKFNNKKELIVTVRGSSTSELLNHALAVAGLYEMEEWATNTANDSFFQTLLTIPSSQKNNDLPNTKPQQAAPLAATEASRPIKVSISLKNNKIIAETFWLTPDGQQLPLFKHSPKTPKERELFIQLTLLSRKSHFINTPQKHILTLESLAYIPTFLTQDINRWHNYFTIEIAPNVQKLAKPILQGRIHLYLKNKDNDQLETQYNVIINDTHTLLPLPKISQKNTENFYFLSDHGIIQLDTSKTSLLADPDISHYTQRYMLFSLFINHFDSVSLHPDLIDWQNTLLHPKPSTELLPSFLRSYQSEGVNWLHHMCSHGCHPLLADEMGLGKTLQILTLIHTHSLENTPHIIVCPASVVSVWQQEAKKFFPSLNIQILSSKNHWTHHLPITQPTIWVASYTQLRRHKHLLSHTHFGYAILDEAQYIKNPEAKSTHACLSIQAKHRIALSGTPLENHPRDLWTLFRFLMPGLLGKRAHFEKEYTAHKEVLITKIKNQITPFTLRRTKSQVASDLPPKTELILYTPLTHYQKELYTQYCDQGHDILAEPLAHTVQKNPLNILTLLLRLRQVCCDPTIISKKEESQATSGKIIALLDKLPELFATNHKVVIFSQFTELLERIDQAITTHHPSVEIYKLTGKTKNRESVIENFQKNTNAAAFLISLKAGGTGITLTSADYVFLVDPWWNPAIENQAIDRLHRIGQTQPVFVYRLITPGTIEERVQALQSEKKQLFETLTNDLQGLNALTDYYHTLSDLIKLT